ncbi:DUF6784 domain-containing protein, partial [Salmonella sp. SAL4446]|uniref:DUF6784 domain-containing protein n=1 Tax=Salmonella sp. SAL4446 TaxID=3159901 RepID=UPI003979D2B1
MRGLENPTGADPLRLLALLAGGLVAAALMALRTHFLWWPFHPIGYVVAETGMGYYM